MVQLNFTTSKHGCHQQFLKHGQKFSFLLIWIMCFWFRKNSQGFLQQHRWQVMKSDGSCYNTMTSMHVDRRENLNGFPPTEFSLFLWFRHINKPLLYHWFCKYLSDERIYPLAPRRWSVHLLSRRCWVWSTSKRQDDPESFIIHGRLYFSATLSCVLGFLTLTSTQFKTYH